MLTIKDISELQKSRKRTEVAKAVTNEMSLAAAIELACWRVADAGGISVGAAESRIWRAFEMLGWPNSSSFARAQNGSLVLQRLPSESGGNAWTALKLEFMRTLRKNGFSHNLSCRLTGALAELANNVWDHSGRIDTGLLAFEVQNRKFTLAIADLGVGVLKSLRANPRFSSVHTHRTAIERALVPGVSRFEDPSRGMGFIDFLSVVTDLHGIARLRTGDIALTIDRRQEEEIRHREYLIDFPGFQISLYCSLPPSKEFS